MLPDDKCSNAYGLTVRNEKAAVWQHTAWQEYAQEKYENLRKFTKIYEKSRKFEKINEKNACAILPVC